MVQIVENIEIHRYAYILLISSAIIAHAVVVIKRPSVVIFTESIFIENNLKEKLIKSNNK